jgi:hypothetical protein
MSLITIVDTALHLEHLEAGTVKAQLAQGSQ